MEPDILVCGEKPGQLGADDTNDISKHRDEDKTAIKGKHQTSTTRSPDRKTQGVEAGKASVGCLKKIVLNGQMLGGGVGLT